MDAAALTETPPTAAPGFDRFRVLRDLGPLAFAVFELLRFHQGAAPTVACLAGESGRSARQVAAAIAALARAGYIARKRRRNTSALTTVLDLRETADQDLRNSADPEPRPAGNRRSGSAENRRSLRRKEDLKARDSLTGAAATPQSAKRERQLWPDLPPGFGASTEFLDLLRKWRCHRGRAFTPAAAVEAYDEWQGWGLARTVAALKHSLRKSYAGVFEPNSNGRGRPGVDGQGTPAEKEANHAKWANVSQPLEP